jgi:hypothetical protein
MVAIVTAKIGGVFIAILFVLCCSCGLFGDQGTEAVDSAAPAKIEQSKKPQSKSFAAAFFVASAADIAYENAVGVLHQTVELYDLESSIRALDEVIEKHSRLQLQKIYKFVEILVRIRELSIESSSNEELEEIEIALTEAYDATTKELNAHIAT